MLMTAGLAGPVSNWSVTVGRSRNDKPVLEYSCKAAFDAAALPAIRVKSFVQAFAGHTEVQHFYRSICSYDCTVVMEELLEALQRRLGWFQCLPRIPKGCADIGTALGATDSIAQCPVNTHCLPNCEVSDLTEYAVNNDATELERTKLPPCLEIMPDGTRREGNVDRDLAYAKGRPPERDSELPVLACWYLAYNAQCAQSNHAALVIARRNDPPPRTFAEVSCRGIEATETQCADGVDNDQDCLIDSDDPDC
jgi:hypothetical protein